MLFSPFVYMWFWTSKYCKSLKSRSSLWKCAAERGHRAEVVVYLFMSDSLLQLQKWLLLLGLGSELVSEQKAGAVVPSGIAGYEERGVVGHLTAKWSCGTEQLRITVLRCAIVPVNVYQDMTMCTHTLHVFQQDLVMQWWGCALPGFV